MLPKMKPGERYNFIEVISEQFIAEHGPKKHRCGTVRCRCDCGKEFLSKCLKLRHGRRACSRRCPFANQQLLEDTVVKPEKRIVLVEEKYGKWTVIGNPFFRFAGTRKNPIRVQYARCQCECGQIADVMCTNLIYDYTKSCGCLARETTSKLLRKGTLAKDGRKTCGICFLDLPIEDFESDKTTKDLYRYCCRRCRKSAFMLKTHGLSIEKYEEMELQQDGRCAICNTADVAPHLKHKGKHSLFIDHDHKTGEIRGLLCSKCNTSLGGFKDSVELLQKAIEYLKRNSTDENNRAGQDT